MKTFGPNVAVNHASSNYKSHQIIESLKARKIIEGVPTVQDEFGYKREVGCTGSRRTTSRFINYSLINSELLTGTMNGSIDLIDLETNKGNLN